MDYTRIPYRKKTEKKGFGAPKAAQKQKKLKKKGERERAIDREEVRFVSAPWARHFDFDGVRVAPWADRN